MRDRQTERRERETQRESEIKREIYKDRKREYIVRERQ